MLKCAKQYGTAAVLIVALIFLCSCGPVFSIHALYTASDTFFEPRLLGTWLDPKDAKQPPIVFERDGTAAYRISMVDSTNTSVTETYEAHVVKLGGQLFIDVVQSDVKDANGSLDVFQVPGHILGRVSLGENDLTIHFLDEDWMKAGLQAGSISIPHEMLDDGAPILTASTAELQKFVLDHAEEKAFSVEMGPLQRRK